MKTILNSLLKGQSLSRDEAHAVMDQLSSGRVSSEQAAALLTALRMKTETVDEIVGFVQSLRQKAKTVNGVPTGLMDVCGTGGDNLGTFNVSTTTAFVVAAAGQPIAKHGNRSVSSRSGSFDVLEALGLSFVSESDDVKTSLERFGLVFLFAPSFHPAMKNVAAVRKNLGVYTVFNVLGPLLNPVDVKRQIIGVYDIHLLEKVAMVLRELGTEEAMVIHGHDGLDEFSVTQPTEVVHLKDGSLTRFTLQPENLGLQKAALSEIQGGSAQDNARILIDVLKGTPGPCQDTVLLNSAAALVVGGKASDFKQGLEMARCVLKHGKAFDLLNRMRAGT